ncbi:hypothetical protein DFJ58DRAFT_60754 [Suillus subalutaceus]|uniref:uncharacterized protein n=1 Tax=Suillus subalutaceus TaxID=48586 RepID=UPI001B85FE67|nr:uncharacterized protein DFJ58DRAFT_60754 [Suillus subalutaceus]KAG1869348.1 hypothetical protein DFJ58DRAFT_60754 [Suillus subalutaceus]
MLTEYFTHWQNLYKNHREEMGSRLLSVASGSSPLEDNVQLISAVVIIFEHSFYVFDKRRYLQDKQESVPSFYAALEQYIASPHAAVVREGVSAAVQAYEEAVTTATHAYEEAVRTLPTWKAKLPFERFKRKAARPHEKEKESLCSQAKAELTNTILEITLNHRLPRP